MNWSFTQSDRLRKGGLSLQEKAGFGLHALAAIGMSFLGFAAAFLANIVIARILGVEGKGLFSLFLITVMAVIAFSGLGVGHGQMYHASKDPGKLKHFLPNGAAISLIFGGGIAVLLLLCGKIWSFKILTVFRWEIILVAILIVPVLSMLTFQRQFLLTTHQYGLSKTNFFVNQTMPLVFYALFYAFGFVSIRGMIIAFAAGQFMTYVAFHIFLRPRVPAGSKISIPFAKESISFGIRQYFSDVVIFLTQRLDFFIMAWFLGQRGLGIYSVAVSLAEIASRLPSELGTILFPAFASGRLGGGAAAGILRKTVFSAALGAVILALIGERLILFLFGSQFSGAPKVFYLLLPGIVAWSTIYVTWNHVSAGGRPGVGIPIFSASAIVDASLNAVLLPRVGVWGAGFAASCSYWLAALLFLRVFCKQERCSLKEALLVNRADVRDILGSLNYVGRNLRRKLRASN
jgi:O-antigen/teichoic acid export membrane protein